MRQNARAIFFGNPDKGLKLAVKWFNKHIDQFLNLRPACVSAVKRARTWL